MVEGAVVDGIGNALYGAKTFTKGEPDKKNFNKCRIISYSEAPASINVHFVQSSLAPTSLGKLPFPPGMPALANALYQATDNRFYNRPFIDELEAST